MIHSFSRVNYPSVRFSARYCQPALTMDSKKTGVKSVKKRKRAWKPVTLDSPSFFAGDMEGFVSLEVLEDYDLDAFTQRDTGSSALGGHKAAESGAEEATVGNAEEENSQSTEPKKKKRKKLKKEKSKKKGRGDTGENQQEKQQESPVKGEVNMSGWNGLGIEAALLQALEEQGFSSPTPIQALSIPPAVDFHQDIIGAAETGSGKTLAFGIPVLQHILKSKQQTRTPEWKSLDESSQGEADQTSEAATAQEEATKNSVKRDGSLLALVMTPTRELALQVKDHLQQAAKHTSIRVIAVVGGMAPQKQQRLLRQRPEIVVATPGRLWELMSENEEHLSDLKRLRFLVLDEADRMVAQGHFQELTSILDFIKYSRSDVNEEGNEEGKGTKKGRIQKFIFSATLTLPRSFRKRGKEHKISSGETLASLIDKVDLNKKSCKVVDVTSKKGTVETLTEAQITCSTEEKDVYLYYFLLRCPGRTLVFANTIDCVRRVASVLRLLGRAPWPLHASMQQRQRLKNLDRFKASETGLLLATDVAARGLDIPDVQHVIHYQVPKDPELYIHRSGRTARASREGLSVVFVGPDDAASYKKIMKTLNGGNELQPFPVDTAFIPGIKKRLKLANEIDKEELKLKRKHTNNNWLLAAAKAMDIEVDDDLLEDLGDSKERKEVQSKPLAQRKAALSSLLETPLIPVGFSGKYPTKSGKLVVPGMADNSIADNTQQVAVAAVKSKRRKKGRT